MISLMTGWDQSALRRLSTNDEQVHTLQQEYADALKAKEVETEYLQHNYRNLGNNLSV